MAETVASLLTSIYDITKREDLVAETKLAIRMATLRAHHSDYYPRDLEESGITWTSPAYIQSLEYKKVFPFFRNLKYLRKYNDSAAGKFFEIIVPELVLDAYQRTRSDVCYLAGRMIEIRSSTQDSGMLVGYYRDPDVTEANYSSWIADDYPHIIIMEAAAVIFKMIGFDEQSSQFERLSQLNIAELKANAIRLGGY